MALDPDPYRILELPPGVTSPEQAAPELK